MAEAARSRSLPPVVVDRAAMRVSRLALVTAIALPAVQIARAGLQPAAVDALFTPLNRLVLLAAVLISLAVFSARQFRLTSPSTVLRLGMSLEVIVAFALSMIETTQAGAVSGVNAGISAVGPWLLIVGAAVPNRPERTVAAALAAATTWPVAYGVNTALGTAPTLRDLAWLWPILNYGFAAVTYFIRPATDGNGHGSEPAESDLGGYRLESQIGEGGMGEVWKASHRLLARAAAVKIIRADVIEREGREADLAAARFRREANLIARLQSPHTVYLYDFGISPDGRFYYVMELLHGISLQALVSDFGAVPPARAVSILSQMCESLHEAHERGLVHRDLKPSNVMLCRVALTYDFVKVLDFGLAKSVGDPGVTQLTMAGTTTGTPGYMAPEIAVGEGTVDRRADIYALGCVAYFLLTGTTVFEEANPTRMALMHVQQTPEPPSARAGVTIPPELEQLVMQCLAKKPADRPPTMAVVAGGLAACGVKPWTSAESRSWWNQHAQGAQAN